ncbi:MAG: sulfotransferase family 2 domain-containing protein [Pseudomonadota bacterium]
MSAPELVFLHIPKTAGTSQRSAFQRHYGKSKVYWHSQGGAAGNASYSKEAVGNRFVVGGHKGLSFYPRKLDALFCAIVRDPVERAISLFGYYTQPSFALVENKAGARARARHRLQKRSLDPDSMLRSIKQSQSFREEISNRQCVYLSIYGNRFADVRETLKKRDHLIGSVARYDLFHRELEALLGWPRSSPIAVNRSKANYAAPFLEDRELVELLRELNQEDQELFNWVHQDCGGIWRHVSNETDRCRRLQSLQVLVEKKRPRDRRDEIDAQQYWPRRQQRTVPWPLSQCVIAPAKKLAYAPQPGAADNIIKKMMVKLSSAEHRDVILSAEFDWVTDRFVTGMLLDDCSGSQIASMARSKEYFIFAMVYEPFTRLVDLFSQRFVKLRDQLPNWGPLYQLLADSQKMSKPDLRLGISFRQFVRGCISGRYKHRVLFTQTRHLPWPDRYDRFYCPQQLGTLVQDLGKLRGVSISLPELTTYETLSNAPSEAVYADTPAGRLPADPADWRQQLLDASLLKEIGSFYAMDFKLYNRTQRNRNQLGIR